MFLIINFTLYKLTKNLWNNRKRGENVPEMVINKAFIVPNEATRKKTGDAKGSGILNQKGFQIVTRRETHF